MIYRKQSGVKVLCKSVRHTPNTGVGKHHNIVSHTNLHQMERPHAAKRGTLAIRTRKMALSLRKYLSASTKGLALHCSLLTHYLHLSQKYGGAEAYLLRGWLFKPSRQTLPTKLHSWMRVGMPQTGGVWCKKSCQTNARYESPSL